MTKSGSALPDWFRQLQFKLSMVTTWAKEEEDAQQVLDDYATYYTEAWHGEVPANLRELTPDVPYRVDMSDALLALREETIAHYEAQVEQTP